jgi:hypothetical protein
MVVHLDMRTVAAEVGQGHLRQPAHDVPQVGLVTMVVEPAQHVRPRERMVDLDECVGVLIRPEQLEELPTLVRPGATL